MNSNTRAPERAFLLSKILDCIVFYATPRVSIVQAPESAVLNSTDVPKAIKSPLITD